MVHARARILADARTTLAPTLAPVAVLCGWSTRLPSDRPRVGSTSRSPRGQVQLSIAQSLCGADITASVGAGLGLTCPSAIAT